MISILLKYTSVTVAALLALYAAFLGLLTTTTFQKHAVYLHRIQMTWFKDLDIPEQFGFLRNQVTPFRIKTTLGPTLYAWHILPIELYRKHESVLVAESSGLTSDITARHAFKLLHEDPEARLVLHFHGAGGTVGSGYRVPNYRALSAGQPDKIHVLSFDYRGFGRSKGVPSENSMIEDATAAVEWATEVAGIDPRRILIFGQSIGTAVSLAILEHFALKTPPTVFAGTVLVAPFVDVPTLVATYRIAGTIPILSPLARLPSLFDYLNTFIQDKWLSKDRIARYIQASEAHQEKYKITLIHAEDDYDIPSHHTQVLYWHAVNAASAEEMSYSEFKSKDLGSKNPMGEAGTISDWRTRNGHIREVILKYGLHDVIMGNPIITMAVMQSFDNL